MFLYTLHDFMAELKNYITNIMSQTIDYFKAEIKSFRLLLSWH